MEREQIYRITNSGKIIPAGELVRCKDCKYRLDCDYWLENGDDWFCADGKRRGADD